MDRKIVEADGLLATHFAASVGARAQRYEPMMTGGETSPEEAIMMPRRCRERHSFVVMDGWLRELPVEEEQLVLKRRLAAIGAVVAELAA